MKKQFFIKSLGIIMVIALLAISVCACGENADSSKTPAQVTEAYINAVKAADTTAMAALSTGNNAGTDATDMDEYGEDVGKAMFSKMEYTVGEATENGDAATVKVNIKNIDMQTVFTAYMTAAMQAAMSGSEVGEEQQSQMLLDEINKAEATYTKDAEVQLTKVDGEWKVCMGDNENTDFINALTGGMADMANSFGE